MPENRLVPVNCSGTMAAATALHPAAGIARKAEPATAMPDEGLLSSTEAGMVAKTKTAMSAASAGFRPNRSEASPKKGVTTMATTAATVPRASEPEFGDRKSTRLNSSHVSISYAVFCLKKKKICYTQDNG